MSKTYLKKATKQRNLAKYKKRKKRMRARKPVPSPDKTSKKYKAQKMYKRLVDLHGKGLLSEKLNNEKFISLMRRLDAGAISVPQVNKLVEDPELIFEKLGELFKESVLPQRVQANIASLPMFCDIKADFIAQVNKNRVNLINVNGGQFSFGKDINLFASDLKITDLPADMRKWPQELRSAYMVRQMYNTPRGDTYIPTKPEKSLAIANKVTPKKLYQIRKINYKPSKKQRRQAKREFDKLSAIKIDESFSNNY